MKSLAGRGALITGSDGGLGFAIAEALADEGCNIVLNGPAESAATAALRERIAAKNVKCVYARADVGSVAEIERMFAAAAAAIGDVDILVNNAVVRHFHPIEEFPVAEWERALAVNVSAVFNTMRLAVPGMKRRNWGRIVNLASIYSTRGAEQRVDYVTAKHAVVGLTRAVALELARTGRHLQRRAAGLGPHAARRAADRRPDDRGRRYAGGGDRGAARVAPAVAAVHHAGGGGSVGRVPVFRGGGGDQRRHAIGGRRLVGRAVRRP